MAAPDAGFKIAARVSGRQLAAVAGVACDAWAPAVGEVQTTERFADRAFHARSSLPSFQEEARLERAREYILQVLDAKFGPHAQEEFAAALQAETDDERLGRLLRLAAQSTGVKQFRDRFPRA